MNQPSHMQVLSITGDIVSAGAIIGVVGGMLPPIAALCAIVWYVLQVVESKTVQKWIKVRRARLRRQRVARIKETIQLALQEHPDVRPQCDHPEER